MNMVLLTVCRTTGTILDFRLCIQTFQWFITVIKFPTDTEPLITDLKQTYPTTNPISLAGLNGTQKLGAKE